MSVNWSEIESTLRAQIISASELPAGKVIWSNQNNPKPEKPYIEINFLDYLRKGAFDLVRPNYEDGTVEIFGIRQLPISIHSWGDGSIRKLYDVADSFHHQDVFQTFHDKNISFADRGNGVKTLTAPNDNKYVEHGLLEIKLEVSTQSIVLDVGYFDSIHVSTIEDITPGTPNPESYAVEVENTRNTVSMSYEGSEIIDIDIEMQSTPPESVDSVAAPIIPDTPIMNEPDEEDITATTAYISWEAVEDALGYFITVLDSDGDIVGTYDDYLVQDTEITLTGLNPADDHTVQIKSYSSEGVSSYDEIEITTPAAFEECLYFSTNRYGANYQIARYDIPSGQFERLTNNALNESFPKLSPDGQYVAFARYTGSVYELWVINLTSLTETKVSSTRNLDDLGYMEFAFNWKPDSSRLLFSDGSAEPRLYRVNPDGTNLTAIAVFTSDAVQAPAYNSAGTKISFRRNVGINNDFQYICNEDTTSQIALAGSDSSRYQTGKTFGHNNKIYWFEQQRDFWEASNWQRSNEDGTNKELLTGNSFTGTKRDDWNDFKGNYAVLQSNKDNATNTNNSIYSYDLTAKTYFRLTDAGTSVNDYYPVFNHDGSKVYFNRANQIYSVNSDGTGVAQLFSDANVYRHLDYFNS
jgi:Tol biopolymer transport system component